MGIFDCSACACAAAPAAPDYSAIATANAESAKLAAESAANDLAFRKEQYANSLPYMQNLQDLAQKIGNQQYDVTQQQQALSKENTDYWRNTFQPMERQTAMDAIGSSYLSDADRAKLSSIVSGTSGLSGEALTSEMDRLSRAAQEGSATQAQTQATALANNAFAQQARNLTRMGGDPNRIANAAAALASQQTAAEVGAANQARQSTLGQQEALRSGVANFGRNMPNTAAQAVGTALNAGNAAVGNAATAANAAIPWTQTIGQGFTSGIQAGQVGSQAALGMGNLMSNDYRNSLSAWGQSNAASQSDSGGLGGFGTLLGIGMKFLADGGNVDSPHGAPPDNGLHGGALSGPGNGVSDSINAVNTTNGQPVKLSTGEYILPADTVRAIGKAKLDQLVRKTHVPARVQRRAIRG